MGFFGIDMRFTPRFMVLTSKDGDVIFLRHSVDNGSPYKNEQFRLICAGLGIVLINSRVRQPQGRGKQERLFRTIQQGWVYYQNFNEFSSLIQLNDVFQAWLQKDYANKEHRNLDCSPRERFLRDQARLRRLPSETIEQNFQGLSRSETATYLESRLKACGVHQPIFQDNAVEAIAAAANGSVRQLNPIASKALLLAASQQQQQISADMILNVRDDMALP